METNQKGDLETIGVSRSGRVRKKSSKLVDFQSPDDIEPKTKKIINKTTIKGFKNRLSSPTIGDDDQDEENKSSEGELNDMIIDEEIDEDENGLDPSVRQSLYMSEKSNKKKVLKDGKVVYGKAQRKDKGKTRITAYMLWARDARKTLGKQDSDFANTSRRLGDLWANVPTNEKSQWRRRAKRYTVKEKKVEAAKIQQLNKPPTNSYVNRSATTPRTKKLSQSEIKPPKKEQPLEVTTIETNSIFETSPLRNHNQVIQPGVYRVTGIEPLDVAAYMKLLGDNLEIIGERLKEHEGQITISGSLSVLLDSLLCFLGPLMCLTTQVPGLTDNDKNLRDNLQKTLDNIAYVLPGV